MKLKLCLLLVFIITYSWSQSGSTKTFTGNGTFPVPAGVTSIQVQAWGGGGSGGGASGAPLLLGRGAAGGGGGAYASNTLLVTPGATLNVVVASQTSGTTGAGTAGGNSTITGFESAILAAGGSGGDANNAGGSPIGGAGGTTAASAGSVKFAGANGGNGNSWNLLGLLLSSGAGGAGASSGGAGGTAVSGVLLSNAPGNAGSPPGGAGSGAINSALGASQIGGAGAAGRVIISYSCANFSLTSTAATGVCASAGTTSTVTLTGSAASLPVGNYVVTYNRSSPSSTALTANLTVSTAGTGTFTAVGLTTAGSSTITITKLDSESCSSTITTNNTATITVSPASVGGTVNGGTTVCSGSPSGVLTLSGNTGTVVKWQSSVSPFSIWTDIANTNTTYTSGALTATTQFRAVVQSGVCAAVNSAATTVTVSPASVAGIVSGGTTVCSGSPSGLLTLSGNTGTIVKWQSSVSPFSTWTDIANTNTTYTSGALTETTQFRAVVQSGVCAAVNSAATTVTVSPTSVGGTVSVGTSICSGSTSGVLTLSGNTGTVVKWQSSVSPFSTWTDIANTNTTYTSGALTATTQFRAVVQSGACAAVNSAATTVTVSPSPTIAVNASAQNACLLDSGESTPLFYSGTTGSPVTYSIVWNSSPANSFVPVTDAALSSGAIAILVPAGTAVGIYTGTVTVKNAAGCVSSGSVFTVNVNNSPGITTTGTIASVCTSTDSQNVALAYSAAIGSPTRYSIDWNSTANAALLADQDVTPFTFVPSGGSINTIVIPANVPGGTYSGIMTIANATCLKYQPVSITVLPATVGGTVSGGTSICSGSTSGLLTLSGNTGSVVNWQSSVSPFTTWTDIANTNTTYTSGPLAATTQFRAVVQNGICDAVNSAATTVTVNPSPTITAAASAQPACISPSPQNITLSYSATTGSPTTYSIVWSSSPENSFEAVTDAALSGSNITISVPAETAVGTYTGTLTVKNEDGCVSSDSTFTVTVNDLPSIGTFGVMYSVCTSTNAQTGSLEYSFAAGNPTSYAINWEAEANAELLTDQASTPFAFQESGGLINTIVIPANVPGGTYHGTLILSNGSCLSSVEITLNVSPTTVGGTVTGGTTICSGNTSGELTLSDYTGSIINWQSSVSPFTTWTDIENTEPTYTSDALTETTQFRAVIQSGECNEENSEATTVTVSPSPAIILQQPFYVCLYNDVPIYFDISFSGATGSPVSYSVVWDEAASTYFNSETDQPLDGDSLLMTSSIVVPVGIYTGTVTVKNEMGCVSPGISFSINATQAPTISTTGAIDSVCVSTDVQNANLAYSGTTVNPTSYSIDWNSAANAALLEDQASTPFAFSSSEGVINTIQIPANVPDGIYSGTMTISNGTCSNDINVTITISSATVGGTVTGGTTIASGETSGLLTLSGQTGTVVRWYYAVSPYTFWIGTGNTGTTYTSGPLTQTTKFWAGVKNGNCYEVNSEATTVTVVNKPTITTASTTTVCLPDSSSTPATSVLLPYSATTGSPVTYSIVWDSSPANNLPAVTDAALPASPISIAIPAGTSFDTFTGTITVKEANGISSTGVPFSVKIAANATITTTGTIAPVTTSTTLQNTTLSYSASRGNPSSYSINWDSDANNVGFADQSSTSASFSFGGGSLNTINVPANVPAGTYSGSLSVTNGNCDESYPVSITINDAAPTIHVESIFHLCSDGSLTETSLNYNGATGTPVTYSIVWNSSPTNSFVAVTDAVLPASPITIAIPLGTGGGTYTGTLTVKNANGISSSGSAFSIEILATPTIATTGTIDPVTTSASSQNATLSYSASTGSPYSYSIFWSLAAGDAGLTDELNTFATFSPDGGTLNTIQVPANVLPGTYSGLMILTNGNCSNYVPVSITINGVPPTISASEFAVSNCQNSNESQTILSYSETTGSPVTYNIVWNSSPANSFAAVTDASLPASPIAITIPAGTAAGTYTGTLTVKNASGITSLGSNFNVTIDPVPSITTTGIFRTACSLDSFQYAILEYNASTGNPTSYSVDWDEETLTDQPNSQFIFSPSGGALPFPILANTPVGTYLGTMHLFNDTSCSESLSVSLTIIPAIVGGAVTGGTTIASGSTSGLLTLSGHTGSVANWQSSVSPFTSWTSINNTNETYTSGPLTETTQFRAFVQNGTCTAVYSDPTTVTVVTPPTIALATSAQDICSDGSITSTPLFYKGTTGSPETYSIVWNSSPTNSFVAVTDATLPPNLIKIVVPAGTVAGTYTGTLTVKDANGVSSIGSSFTVTVGVIPEISLASDADPVCTSTSLQNTKVYYRDVTGNPTSYSINWNQEANDASLQDQDHTPNVFNEVDGYIETIQISANAQAGTYSGTLIISNDSCSQSLDISITINPSPTPLVIEDVTAASSNTPTGSVTLSGLPSGAWSVVVNPGETIIESSGETYTFGGLFAGTYSFTLNNANVCGSSSVSVSIPSTESSRGTLPEDNSTDLKSLKNPITVSALNKVINVETPNQIIDKVYIFDVSGNLIYEKVGVSDPKLVITDLRSSNQVLVVKVILNNGNSEIRKVIF